MWIMLQLPATTPFGMGLPWVVPSCVASTNWSRANALRSKGRTLAAGSICAQFKMKLRTVVEN